MAINEAIQSSCACYSAEITTPCRALGRSQWWQAGTTWCLVSPATVLASWHENPCHQLLLGSSLREQQMLLELSAKGLLHSQEQLLDVMVLRLAQLLLDTTVRNESVRKWGKQLVLLKMWWAVKHGELLMLPWQVWDSSTSVTQPSDGHVKMHAKGGQTPKQTCGLKLDSV